MFNLEIYRQHWMFFSLAFGSIVMLSLVLWYLAIWRERSAERQVRTPITDIPTFALWVQRAFPWILILIILGTAIFAIVYPQLRAVYPPNW